MICTVLDSLVGTETVNPGRRIIYITFSSFHCWLVRKPIKLQELIVDFESEQ